MRGEALTQKGEVPGTSRRAPPSAPAEALLATLGLAIALTLGACDSTEPTDTPPPTADDAGLPEDACAAEDARATADDAAREPDDAATREDATQVPDTDAAQDPDTDDAGMQDASDADAAGAPRCPSPGVDDPTGVHTPLGTVTGRVEGTTHVYKGIPYAAPPVGPLRWMPSEGAECYGAPLPALEYGPACPQRDGDGQTIGEEDCLTLNVWTPAGETRAARAPVLVFIHGGGNVAGSSSKLAPGTDEALYDGRALSEGFGVVVVTFNYRLGALGWLVHPALDGLDPRGHSGNYGTLDQLAALRWVQSSIGSFGGDPDRVLLFGESAGARNVCVLLATPNAAGLFATALMQSGSCEPATADAVRAASAVQVEGSGCAGDTEQIGACLHARTAAQIVLDSPLGADEALSQGDLEPFADGALLPDEPLAMLRRGEHSRVPLLLGANTDETSLSVPAVPDAASFERLVRAMLPRAPQAERVLAAYPPDDYGGDARRAWVQLTSDARFVCPTRRAARAAAAGQAQPVYRYSFAQPLTRTARSRAAGAFHGVELLFVFQHLGLRGHEPTEQEQTVARAVGHYWTGLASDGDPNGHGLPLWEPYEEQRDDAMLLDGAGIRRVDGVRAEQCDLWDSLAQ